MLFIGDDFDTEFIGESICRVFSSGTGCVIQEVQGHFRLA